jgi:hypothetical protein
MASGALDQEGQFVSAGRGFHGILLCSLVFFLVSLCSWR